MLKKNRIARNKVQISRWHINMQFWVNILQFWDFSENCNFCLAVFWYKHARNKIRTWNRKDFFILQPRRDLFSFFLSFFTENCKFICLITHTFVQLSVYKSQTSLQTQYFKFITSNFKRWSKLWVFIVKQLNNLISSFKSCNSENCYKFLL